MKIIVITSNNPLSDSSAQSNRLSSLLRGLNNFDVQIEIVINGGLLSKNERFTDTFQPIKEGPSYIYLNSFVLDSIWKQRLHTYILGWYRAKKQKNRLIEIIKNSKPDLIWYSLDYNSLKLVTAVQSKFKNIKTFIEISEHFDYYKSQDVNFLQYYLLSKKEALQIKLFQNNVTHVAFMTKNLINSYSQFINKGAKFLHLPMTVDLERFEKTSELKFNKTIVYIGALNNKKDGVDILIKAFSIVSQNFPNWTLLIYGPEDVDKNNLINLVEQLKLTTKVFFKGVINKDKVPSVLKSAGILALPRPKSKQAEGGFPTKLGEYLASSKPVCATRIGEIDEYLIDNESVYFSSPNSVEDFARILTKAIGNYKHAIEIGKNGRKVAERSFNSTIQAEKLKKFLLN
jgi:glycosyltransferase involved in cell wall biosynthesis